MLALARMSMLCCPHRSFLRCARAGWRLAPDNVTKLVSPLRKEEGRGNAEGGLRVYLRHFFFLLLF